MHRIPRSALPGGDPGTLLYQNAPEPIVAPETVVISGLPLVVSETFTWTVDTVGLAKASMDLVSVTSYPPPTVGSSDDLQYWENALGNGFDSSFPPDNSNFYARVHAVSESGAALQLLAGSDLLAALTRRRSSRA
jgi:hypothetical protein